MVVQNSSANGAGACEWVAFEQHEPHGDGGFEAVVRGSKEMSRMRRGDSSRRRSSDKPSVTSWMKQPISTDGSWAPVPPPHSHSARSEHSKSDKRRPPRVRAGTSSHDNAATHRRHTVTPPNPVSSSDSSASSHDHPSRGRSVERTHSQAKSHSSSVSASTRERRGRSRTRVQDSDGHSVQASTTSRGRSSSRSRVSTKDRDRSASTRRSTSDRGSRSGSRPPPTSSNRRSRSSSRTNVTRARSSSRTRSARPPPSTSRTRREMRGVPASNSVGPGLPPRRGIASSRSVTSQDDSLSLRSADANIGRDISFGQTMSTRSVTSASGSASASGSSTPKPRSAFMEKLFGDQVSDEAKQSYLPRHEPSPTASVSSFATWQQPEHIHSRILLTATVYHNTATNLWIATINTNQKGVAKNPATASKYLKAFSFSSEKEARESAIANAPPKMIPFDECPSCFNCNGKFAMFRRASHCRNCGVCICNSCSTTWSSKMIPETYNLKKESQVKICKSCHYLSGSFKKALHDGDYEEAIALYGSGNVNLRTPFPGSGKKEEVMYPIHAAVDGGNIHIVRWLMEDHFCPIKVIRTGSGKKPKRGGSADIPILTSKGRSVLSMAMTGLHVDILRYFVVDCGVSIYESKDLKGSLRALEAVLLALPRQKGEHKADMAVHRWDDASYDGEDMSITSSLGADQTLPDEEGTQGSKDPSRRNTDSCIICYDNPIDCVMTPCGHQVCCLECSANLSACPVCNNRGQFIKIFRP